MPSLPSPETERLKKLAAKAGVPFVALEPEIPVDPENQEEAISALDPAAARAFGVVPVKAHEDTLLIAVSDPLDQGALASIQALTDLQVKIAVAAPERIRRAQDALYGRPRAERPFRARAGIADGPPAATSEQRRYAEAVAREADLPFVSLEPRQGPNGRWHDPVSHEAARRIGAEVCRSFKVIPIAAVGEGIALATADPADRAALNVASLLAGLRAWVVVAPGEDIERAIFRVFGAPTAAP